MPDKLILTVIDGMNPDALAWTIASGRAPVLAAICERGTVVEGGAVAAFPSVTPVCATAIATGVRQDAHGIPGMNWFHRGEGRYVEYGSSLRAARKVGIARQLRDLIYEMNGSHLRATTIFEALDDADVRTAGTTYLIYRGRHEHEVSRRGGLTRLARTVMREPVLGPRELFYADIFESQETPCRSQLGLPGVRDRHAGCVGAYLVENDAFDFLLLSLTDNDTTSHRRGLDAQPTAIAHADRQLQRLADAAGGIDELLERYAFVVCADHGHTPIDTRVELLDAFAEFEILRPPATWPSSEAQIALCPSQRFAMVYVLDPADRGALVPRVIDASRAVEGVDLVFHRDGADGVIEAAASRNAGALRFAPGGDVRDLRGASWRVDGDLEVLAATVEDGVFDSATYPDALARAWSALACEASGDVLISAARGAEFPDWGGAAHVGGSSHGSLHRSDSFGALAFCGIEPPDGLPAGGRWAIHDVADLCLAHHGLATLSRR